MWKRWELNAKYFWSNGSLQFLAEGLVFKLHLKYGIY